MSGPAIPAGTFGRASSIGMDAQGRFVVVYETLPDIFGKNDIRAQRFNADGTCNDCANCPVALTMPPGRWEHVSMRMTDGTPTDSLVSAAWNGHYVPTGGLNKIDLYQSAFNYAAFNPTPVGAEQFTPSKFDNSVSLGLSSNATALAFTRGVAPAGEPFGLVYRQGSGPVTGIAPCDQFCQPSHWQPCVAMRSDGYGVIAWAAAELPLDASAFNVMLRAIGPSGAPIGPDVSANMPSAEVPFSAQRSPAIDIVGGQVVACWIGVDTTPQPKHRVFARRFAFSESTGLAPNGSQFIVDSPDLNGVTYSPADYDSANPTVAITRQTDPTKAGRFVVAWNAIIETDPQVYRSIVARFFDAEGWPLSGAYEIAQVPGRPPQFGVLNIPSLAESAQHTLAYGATGAVVATWTLTAPVPNDPPAVWYSKIPETFIDNECWMATPGCAARGDLNTDGFIDARDIQPFIDVAIARELPSTPIPFEFGDPCAYDINTNCRVDAGDIPAFVCLLFEMSPTCSPPEGPNAAQQTPHAPVIAASGTFASLPADDGIGVQTNSAASNDMDHRVRLYARWLNEGNARVDHPEMSDEQYYRMWKRKMIELDLWREE